MFDGRFSPVLAHIFVHCKEKRGSRYAFFLLIKNTIFLIFTQNLM